MVRMNNLFYLIYKVEEKYVFSLEIEEEGIGSSLGSYPDEIGK
jgi:hypothetical protein